MGSEHRWFVMLGCTTIQVIYTSEAHVAKMIEDGWVRGNGDFLDEAAASEYANKWESKGSAPE